MVISNYLDIHKVTFGGKQPCKNIRFINAVTKIMFKSYKTNFSKI